MFSFDLKSGYHHIDIRTSRALEIPWIRMGQWLQGTVLRFLCVTFWLGDSLLPFHQTYASPSQILERPSFKGYCVLG